MGQQHNTHVYNNTGDDIKIVLTDSYDRNTTHVLRDQEVTCIPTPHGTNTVSVFEKENNKSNFKDLADASYTNYSDRSFIVKRNLEGHVQIVRSVYGSVRTEETSMQQKRYF